MISKQELKEAARLLGARGGKAKSARKAAASIANGKKGGRPRNPNEVATGKMRKSGRI